MLRRMNKVLDPDAYPQRINKHLAVKGYDTRRGADALVKAGLVTINGTVAKAGDWVQEGDKVEVRQKGPAKKLVYYAYSKPKGVITHSPQADERDIWQVTEKSGMPRDVFPLGRLDKDSYGLIILTNDGRITDRLLNPAFAHEKEYVVQTKLRIKPMFKKIMEDGVDIEGYRTRPCSVTIVDDNEFSIRLQEGKKHQIRRMVVAMRNDVTSLKRIRIMNVKLGRLAPGEHRPIEGEELAEFLKELGL